MSPDARARLKSSDWFAMAALCALLLPLVRVLPSAPWREAVVVTIGFAVAGWLLRGVNGSGSLAGGLVAFTMYVAIGWRMFAVLVAVFVLTLLATFAGRARKQTLGLAEPRTGRSATQVAANLLVAATAVVALPATVAAAVALAALVEATADTVSSETGQAFGRKTYLLTTMRPTRAGTNGGVSLIGTLGGITAAACVVAVGLLVMDAQYAITAGLAGILGMMMDSLLGATLEHDCYLNNDGVNLAGTGTAAVIAYLLLMRG